MVDLCWEGTLRRRVTGNVAGFMEPGRGRRWGKSGSDVVVESGSGVVPGWIGYGSEQMVNSIKIHVH